MLLKPIWTLFSQSLFAIPSTSQLFNPYYPQDDSDHDLPHAHQIRRDNLRNYLESFRQRPPILIIGEAPGWRGCRFSGVPFTSESQLLSRQLPFKGHRSSHDGTPLAESSATIFWRLMAAHHPRFLVWNCLPFHPHQLGQTLSNRTPTRAEIRQHAPFLAQLLSILNPDHVVALGRSAEHALRQLSIHALYVRHPSHGGAQAFRSGIEQILTPYLPAV